MNTELYTTYAITDYMGELKIDETLWIGDAKAAADKAQTQHPAARVIVVRWNSATNHDEVIYEATQPQAEPVKATVIADIQKEIVYSSETRDYDMYITIDGTREYIGTARTYGEAEVVTNQYAYDYLMDSHTIETAAELLMRAL